jgi:hypothetical protein
VLRAAGWRVSSLDASTPLAVAWERLPRTGLPPAPPGLPPELAGATPGALA